MAIPNIFDVIRGVQVWAVAHRGGMVRGLLLLGVWGLALFGYASLGEQALQQRLPPVRDAMTAHAQEIATFLDNRVAVLAPLASDPRIPAALASEEGTESLDIRRALYEFGYLNRITNLYVWDETSGNRAQLASSAMLEAPVIRWLQGLAEAKQSVVMVTTDKGPALYAAMHVTQTDGVHAYVITPLGVTALMSDMPPPPALPGLAGGTSTLLTNVGGSMWELTRNPRTKPAPAEWIKPSRAGSLDVVETARGLMVTAPVPSYAGWAVALPLPPAMALGTSRYAQMGVLGLAALLSLVLLWKPTLPLRRKVIKAVISPVLGAIQPLTAPMLASVAAVVNGKAQPAQPKFVNLNEKTFESSAPVRRGRAVNLGGPSKPRSKTATASYVPALKGSIATVASEDVGAVPDVPKDSLAAMVDECFNESRTQLLYQPMYNARTGQPVMHEVLLRLIDREGQPMTPAVFIPICQQYGWMERLDAHVVKRVMEINFAGGAMPSTPLALNLSGDTMDSISYLETMMNMDDVAIMKNLVFEVRSQELMQDPKAFGFLRECRDMGVKLSVDYFGGGTAMVETSKKLGFDYIKMDCTRFASDTMAKKELIMLCRAAIKLNLPVILEKMETVEMEVYARRIGVNVLQGYLLGKPKPEMVTGPLPGWSAMAKDDEDVVVVNEVALATPVAEPKAASLSLDALPPADPNLPLVK